MEDEEPIPLLASMVAQGTMSVTRETGSRTMSLAVVA